MAIKIIGKSKEGIPILLDTEKETISYKENEICFHKLLEAYNSGWDRIQLTETLVFRYVNGLCIWGCLEIQEETVKKLIQIVWNKLKKSPKAGTEKRNKN